MSGLLTDRFGPRRIYLVGMFAYGVSVFPVFALFGTADLLWFTVGLVVVFGAVHALFYGAQGTLFAGLYPPTCATPDSRLSISSPASMPPA